MMVFESFGNRKVRVNGRLVFYFVACKIGGYEKWQSSTCKKLFMPGF